MVHFNEDKFAANPVIHVGSWETEDSEDFGSDSDYTSEDSSFFSVESEEMDEGEMRKESIFFNFVVLLGTGLITFLIYASFNLYVVNLPCCICDPNFKLMSENDQNYKLMDDESREHFNWYIGNNTGNIYSSYSSQSGRTRLSEKDILSCLRWARSDFYNASYEYEDETMKSKNDAILTEEEHTTAEDGSNFYTQGHKQTLNVTNKCAVRYDPQYYLMPAQSEEEPAAWEVTNTEGPNATNFTIQCDPAQTKKSVLVNID